jgi:D-arabinose 1-dehydrogenase-like Zn-dependent alcohol dehydrogenase
MCAGITTYNALRNSGARPGDLVAILGLGGLGHLAVQYAVKMGFKTVGVARGQDKEPLSRKLGAHHYIDSQAQDAAAELQKLGGAKVILATVTNGEAMAQSKAAWVSTDPWWSSAQLTRCRYLRCSSSWVAAP